MLALLLAEALAIKCLATGSTGRKTVYSPPPQCPYIFQIVPPMGTKCLNAKDYVMIYYL